MGEQYVYLISDESSDDDETKTIQSEPPSNSEPHNTVAIIITLSLFAIIISAILAASVVGIEHYESRDSSLLVESMCKVTQQYETHYSCFHHTLDLALKEVENISLLLKTTTLDNNYIPRLSSFVMRNDNCVTLFDDAVYHLSRSFDMMMKVLNENVVLSRPVLTRYPNQPAPPVLPVVLTKEEMIDMKTWVSNAMTDQEMCVNGLEEMGLTNEMKMLVERSSDLLSNCLDILDNMDRSKFGSWASFVLSFIPFSH